MFNKVDILLRSLPYKVAACPRYSRTDGTYLTTLLKLCQQKQKAGLEDCGGGVEWGDEGELTFQTVVDKRDWHSKQQHQDSSSSDEDDEDARDMHMEVDTTDRMFPYVSSLSGHVDAEVVGSLERPLQLQLGTLPSR